LARLDRGTAPAARRQDERAESLRRELAEWAAASYADVRVVRSPYRVCPLGAHVDHQLGEVTGMALDRALLMAFVARDDARVVVRSHQFPGVAEFAVDETVSPKAGDWADYARGAVSALRARRHLRRGMSALLDGHDDVGGLSSSAAAGVAYLLALESANGLDLSPRENVELDRAIENDYIGLDNGILDQAVILLSRPGQLTHVDCATGESRLVPLGGGNSVSVAVLFSGLRVPLHATDYNLRVAECREAAALLLRAAGMRAPERPHLRAVPPDAFVRYGPALPDNLRRRAVHFFGEQERVRRGVELWRQGDLQGFGRLVSESGRSSVENYECGNPHLRTACEALRDSPGVYGARFSGGGFRGCCIGLAQPGAEEEIARASLARYLRAHPDMEGRARVYFCRSAQGAGLLD
jgi:galactokinase